MKKKTIDQAKELLEAITAERDYWPDHSEKMFSVDVKLYGQEAPTGEELAERYPKKYKKRIIEKFTDEKISAYLNDELVFEQRYWIEDALDQFEGREKYLATLLNKQSFGFYGRSGGHFCFDILSKYVEEALAQIADDDKDGFEMFGFWNTPEDCIAEAKDTLEAILWWKNEIRRAKQNIESKEWAFDVLNNAIENEAGDWDYDDTRKRELAKARRLAKKYGYIVAKEIAEN